MKKLALASLLALPLVVALPAAAAQKDKKQSKGAGKTSKDTSKDTKHDGAKSGKNKKKGQAPAEAASPKKHEEAMLQPVDVRLDIQRATLDNGLRVVLAPDHSAATVAVAVTYDVGSRNEQKARTGFAHLFEHMMFEGSKNVAKTEHFKLVSSHGGVLNGTTNRDRTNYYETLPSNELALALWLEADRMKSLDVSQENLDNQRKVVEEEFRMRYLNVPYKLSQFRLEALVYQGFFPYEHVTIGEMKDLDAAKLDWVADFHARHYGPNNAVLSVSGDFDPAGAMDLVHKYFDGVPKIDAAPYEDAPFPEQTSERTAVLEDDLAVTPGVMIGWAVPPMHSTEHYALEIAADVLAGGESSRLYQNLVREKSAALAIDCSVDGRRGPDLFECTSKASPSGKTKDIERAIEDQVKQLAERGPTDAELAKSKRRAESSFVLGLSTNLGRALRLGEFETYFSDARELNAELPRYFAVTKDDVKRVVAQYLSPTRRTVVETTTAADKEQNSGKPPPKKQTAAPPPKAEAKKKGAGKPAGKKGGKR